MKLSAALPIASAVSSIASVTVNTSGDSGIGISKECNFEKVEESSEFLSKFGNLMKEGRPKTYNSAEKLIFELKNIDPGIEIIMDMENRKLRK